MAKRKKQYGEGKKKFQYGKEIQGLILILFSLVGLGDFGIVGNVVKKFSIFLFGTWYVLVMVITLCLGVYLIAKRSKPDYFNGRLVGIYSLILALLLFSHINYIKDNSVIGKEIVTSTYENITAAFNTESEIRNTGGGIIGAATSWLFVSLFSVEGTSIVMIIIAGFGLIMVFDLTIADIFGSIGNTFKKIFSKDETKRKIDESYDDEDEEDEDKPVDKRVVITSVEDLEPKKIETVGNIEKTDHIEYNDETSEFYVKPPITLLNLNQNKGKVNSTEYISNNTKTLERVFQDFGMRAKVIEVHVGPAVTQYEMDLERGTKVNKVLSISREIALALAAKEVRIEAPIPGKNTVGVEIPNQTIVPVSMREIMEAMRQEKKLENSILAAPLGRDIMGNVKYVEINKTPHMLVAGATGAGKSVCINNIIISILMRATPDEVKMVLVDPKKVEFNVYEGIPHLLMPVVTDPKKASAALQKIVVEMDERYETFKNSGTKNIQTYNEYVDKELKKKPDCGLKRMPFILVIIDELADLMLVAAKEVEESIMRITQLARAAGIHLIVATQRPSTDIITGVVKSNIPTRISFAVSSSIDSRTILDMTGAEKLLGKGDMLYKPMGQNVAVRIQGNFISDDEIERVIKYVSKQQAAQYDESITVAKGSSDSASGSTGGGGASDDEDPLMNEIIDFAVESGKISASLVQRRFRLGYNRAARIIDELEARGIIGPQNGSKPREVLVKVQGEE